MSASILRSTLTEQRCSDGRSKMASLLNFDGLEPGDPYYDETLRARENASQSLKPRKKSGRRNSSVAATLLPNKGVTETSVDEKDADTSNVGNA